MTTMINPIKCLSVLALGLLTAPFTTSAQESTSASVEQKVVLGTFDSRGIAMAYYRSDMFKEDIEDVRKKHKKLEEAGKMEEAKELETSMGDLQKHIHSQGFGNAPVPEIMKLIKDKFPSVAERAKVDVIVSKWDLFYSNPSAHTVDVTMLLAEEFSPSKETWEIVKDVMTADPIPLEDLDHDH